MTLEEIRALIKYCLRKELCNENLAMVKNSKEVQRIYSEYAELCAHTTCVAISLQRHSLEP